MNFLFLLSSWHGVLVSRAATDARCRVCLAHSVRPGLGPGRPAACAQLLLNVCSLSIVWNKNALHPLSPSLPHPRLFSSSQRTHLPNWNPRPPYIINRSSILQALLQTLTHPWAMPAKSFPSHLSLPALLCLPCCHQKVLWGGKKKQLGHVVLLLKGLCRVTLLPASPDSLAKDPDPRPCPPVPRVSSLLPKLCHLTGPSPCPPLVPGHFLSFSFSPGFSLPSTLTAFITVIFVVVVHFFIEVTSVYNIICCTCTTFYFYGCIPYSVLTTKSLHSIHHRTVDPLYTFYLPFLHPFPPPP